MNAQHKKRKNKLCFVAITSALALSSAEPILANPNLVVNGGFETGDFTGWTQVGNRGATGVSGNFGGVDPYDGIYQGFFGAVNSLGGIEQTLAVTPGDTYKISFWLYNFGGTPSEYKVMWGSSTLTDVVNPSSFGYTEYTFTAVAGGPNLILGFQQNPSYFLLDDVRVSAVPDSGLTIAMLGTAMTGLALIRRKA